MNIRKTVAAASTGGLVMTAFGLIAANPAFAATCEGVTPIPATEAALRTALAGTDPVICINAGTINLSSTGSDTTASSIEITRDVTIIGLGEVIFDSHGESAVFFVDSLNVDLELDHLTLDDAADNGAGGAIYFNSNGNLTIRNSVVRNNDSADPTFHIPNSDSVTTVTGSTFANNVSSNPSGGVIYSTGTVNIDDSQFTNNDASSGWGGALYARSITVADSTFEGNTAGDGSGGAIYGWNDVTVTNSNFTDNTSDGDGGAIYSYGNLSVSDSTFIDNIADNGGGGAVYTVGGLDASGSYFNGNESAQDGGAIWGADNSTLVNDTYVGNYSDENGGAVRVGNSSEVLFNTFTENEAAGSGNAINSLSFTSIANVFADGSDLEIQNNGQDIIDGGGNVSTSTQAGDADDLDDPSSLLAVSIADLKLGAPADNGGPTWTVALGDGSIARDRWTAALDDAATSENIPTVDQRGTARALSYDAGAYEATPTLAATGVDTTGIALTGGVIGATGVALVARRRRSRA